MTASADRIVSGRIATFAGATGFGWVDAIAIADGRVLAAGRRDDLDALVGPRTRRLTLPPESIALPGIVEAHVHLTDAAAASRRVDLEPAATIDEGLARIEAHALRGTAPAPWIEGGGWDPGRWGRWPTAADLERVAADRLVVLWSHDRHALWVSRAVLRLARIDRATPDPAGGAIRRDESGEPTGVLQETAASLVLSYRDPADDLESLLAAYCAELPRLGIVGAHHAGDLETPLAGLRAIAALADRGRLPIRVHASVREGALEHALQRGWRTGDALGNDPRGRARVGWLKLFADGALGSRTALLLEPYVGEGDHGLAVTGAGELAALAGRAHAAGIAPQVHAIGDGALRTVLDLLEPLARRGGGGPMARVEHVQLAQAGDVPRFAAAGIAASVQPIHLRTDHDKARSAWGPARAERDAFRVRSLVEAGAVVAFGTDAPVEPVDPWPGIAIAVTRRSAEWGSDHAFGPTEAVDLATALRAATVGPARVAGDPLGGRLVAGAPADLIVVKAEALDTHVEPGGPLEQVRPDLVLIGGVDVLER